MEIDYWVAPRDPAAQTLNERLLATVQKPGSPQDALEQSFLLFDETLLQIRQKQSPQPSSDSPQPTGERKP
jgi:hypothetical protein